MFTSCSHWELPSQRLLKVGRALLIPFPLARLSQQLQEIRPAASSSQTCFCYLPARFVCRVIRLIRTRLWARGTCDMFPLISAEAFLQAPAPCSIVYRHVSRVDRNLSTPAKGILKFSSLVGPFLKSFETSYFSPVRTQQIIVGPEWTTLFQDTAVLCSSCDCCRSNLTGLVDKVIFPWFKSGCIVKLFIYLYI